MKKAHRLRQIFLGVPVALCAILAIFLGYKCSQPKSFLTVADVSVSRQIYRQFLQDEKANTANEFMSKYHAAVSDTFWETQYGKTTPHREAQKKALNALSQFIVEDKALVSAKLLDEPLAEFCAPKQMNSTGANLSQWSMAQKMHHELMIKLLSRYAESHRGSVTKKQKLAFYHSNARKYWEKPKLISYKEIRFERGAIKDPARFTELVRNVTGQSTDLDAVHQTFKEAGFPGQLIGTDSSHDENRYYGAYLNSVDDTARATGVVSAVWLSEESMSLIQVISSTNEGAYSYADVENDVTARFLKAKMRTELSKKAKQAAAEIDQTLAAEQKMN